jgi:serine/threonine-protein kinase
LGEHTPTHPSSLGQYLLFDELASGGMAVIHIGVRSGAAGFARAVAVKRLHTQHAKDPEFVAMFADEARLSSRIRHPNVISPMDVVTSQGELFLVMELVLGESLKALLNEARGGRVAPPIAARIALDVLAGLSAAHGATDETGKPLRIIHRDVSLDNVLVGGDGIARLLDFGIAKARVRLHATREGRLKGKLRYMAPEQFLDRELTPSTDVYSASIVLWEMLTGRRLFSGSNEAAILAHILHGEVLAPSRFAPDLTPELDSVVLRGLSRNLEHRFATAESMAIALEAALPAASYRDVARWVSETSGPALDERARRVSEIERSAGQATLTTPIPRSSAGRSEEATLFQHRSVPPSRLIAQPSTDATHTLTVQRPIPTSAPPQDRSKARGASVGIGLVALLAALGIGFAFWQRSTPNTASIASPQPPSVPTPSAAAASVGATPHEAPIASAAPTVASATNKVTSSRSMPRVGTARARSLEKKPANCNPPWDEDANGFRRVKRGCL